MYIETVWYILNLQIHQMTNQICSDIQKSVLMQHSTVNARQHAQEEHAKPHKRGKRQGKNGEKRRERTLPKRVTIGRDSLILIKTPCHFSMQFSKVGPLFSCGAGVSSMDPIRIQWWSEFLIHETAKHDLKKCQVMSPFFQKDSLHFSQVKLLVKKRQDRVVFDGWVFCYRKQRQKPKRKNQPQTKNLHLTNLADFRKINNFDVTGFFPASEKKKQQAPNLQQPTKHILIRNSCQFSPEIIDNRSYNKTHRHISHTSHTESRDQ